MTLACQSSLELIKRYSQVLSGYVYPTKHLYFPFLKEKEKPRCAQTLKPNLFSFDYIDYITKGEKRSKGS